MRADGRRIDRVGHTGGRPLGLELLPDGRLLVCDANRGLLALDSATGAIEVLATRVDGARILVLQQRRGAQLDGDIYFSDSSPAVTAIASGRPTWSRTPRTGRLLCRRTDGSVEVLLEGLRFANGVALAADESYVAVAETGGRTVVRLWLDGTTRRGAGPAGR